MCRFTFIHLIVNEDMILNVEATSTRYISMERMA